jgi:hypothetical protein
MFGLNDSNSQTNNNDMQPPAQAAAQDNPFNDSPPGIMPSPMPAQEPASLTPTAPTMTEPTTKTSSMATPTAPAAPNNLLDLKQQALHSLQPLVGHLDQTPEEKFKTTMMMIQATDNAALVNEAYEAANKITDEKARAQALLDVVNEINYFTQHNGSGSDAKA